MRAVVFDLFGTLTDPAYEISRRGMVEATAVNLGADPVAFWDRWSKSFPERITGGYGGTRATLVRLLSECGTKVADDVLEVALEGHLSSMATIRTPRPGALAVLDELRQRGFKLALMSDCSSEVVESWESTPYAAHFGVTVMSWSEGLRKPDARLYAAVAARLGLPAEECWYVGDGGGRELSGARNANMTPILVTNVDTPRAAAHRADPDDYSPVHQVADLEELLPLVGRETGVGDSVVPARQGSSQADRQLPDPA